MENTQRIRTTKEATALDLQELKSKIEIEFLPVLQAMLASREIDFTLYSVLTGHLDNFIYDVDAYQTEGETH